MLTKLKRILLEENIRSQDLYEEIKKLYDPCVQAYQISHITSGKNLNAFVGTYLKILHALNNMTGKQFTLSDIVQGEIVKEDLK